MCLRTSLWESECEKKERNAEKKRLPKKYVKETVECVMKKRRRKKKAGIEEISRLYILEISHSSVNSNIRLYVGPETQLTKVTSRNPECAVFPFARQSTWPGFFSPFFSRFEH